MEVFGYRIGDFAYVTDCNLIPETSFRLLEGVEILVLDALRHRPHPTHFSVEEAIEMLQSGSARAARSSPTWPTRWITTIPSPPGVEFGYDGLVFDVD